MIFESCESRGNFFFLKKEEKEREKKVRLVNRVNYVFGGICHSIAPVANKNSLYLCTVCAHAWKSNARSGEFYRERGTDLLEKAGTRTHRFFFFSLLSFLSSCRWHRV